MLFLCNVDINLYFTVCGRYDLFKTKYLCQSLALDLLKMNILGILQVSWVYEHISVKCCISRVRIGSHDMPLDSWRGHGREERAKRRKCGRKIGRKKRHKNLGLMKTEHCAVGVEKYMKGAVPCLDMKNN